MINKETKLLEEAYLSITKKQNRIPSEEETVTTEPNEVVSAGPMDEPAPGVDVDMVDSEDNDTTGVPIKMSAVGGMMEDPRMSEEDENEEDEMAITNLHSIRESIMKIAAYVATGGHLEPWQQQKLAIAMDNLAEVARRVY